MIYTKNTLKAMKIAYDAHHGQVDKCGTPYIFHPIHLAEYMDTEEECIVALLHDVVEDTDMTYDDLEKDFSSDIIAALKLLTKNKNDDYMEYVKRIKHNDIARKVKLADLTHNCDINRLNNVTEEDIKRHDKYREAIKLLNAKN